MKINRRHPLFHQWVILGIGMLLLGCGIAFSIYLGHVRTTRMEQERLLSQARIVQENLAWNLDALNKSLVSLQQDRSLLTFSPAYNQRLRDLTDAMPGVRTMLVMDAEGTIRLANHPELIGRNLKERDYFRAAQQHADTAVLHVSSPYKSVLGTYVISVSRALKRTDGTFAGIVAASLDPEYFSTLLSSVQYEKDMWTYLSHDNGKLFLIVPHREGVVGKKLSHPDSMLQRHLASGAGANVFTGEVQATGEQQRMIALRTIKPSNLNMDRALVVAASRDLSAIYAIWREDAFVYSTLFAVLATIASLVLYLYQGRLLEAERQKALAADNIKALNEELDRFFSMSLDLLCITDMEGHFRRLNASWEGALGYLRSELIGKAFIDFVHDDDRAATLAVMADLSADRPIMNFVNRYRCKDGSHRWLEWCSTPYQNRLIYAVARDITELKQNQHELAQRTAEAEAANRAKSEFLANMSHEIRTPMNAILGLTRLVLESELAPRQKELLGKVHSSSGALMGILNDILDYSKIEAGRLDIEHLPMDIGEIVKDSAELFRVRIDEKGLGVLIEIDPELPEMVLGDPLRLAQVFNNLIGNAVKFTEQGEIHIKVEQARVEGGAVTVRCAVRDTGIGLCKEQSDRLFQAFTQADGTITRKYGGTGLGLAICRDLVRLMGGEIQVSSIEGQGATFTFEIQVEKVPPGPRTSGRHLPAARGQISAGSVAAPDGAGAAELRGIRILLVENNRINQEVAAEFLKRRGAAVTLAEHGAEALELIRTHDFDGVLMDLHMPIMDGLEATRRIRALRGDAAPPIIAMTAAVMQDDRERCAMAGLVDFVAKPINPDELMAVLKKWLKQAGTAAAVHTPEPLQDQEHEEAPHSLPDFDLAAALRRLDGNSQLLYSLLSRFAGDDLQVAHLKSFLCEGKVNEALNLVHTVKGMAATLGAVALAESAAALERELRAGAGLPGMERFEREWAAAVSAIMTIPARPTKPTISAGQPVVEAGSIGELLAELTIYLQEQELVPDDLMQKLRRRADSPHCERDAALLKTLLKQMDLFDHAGALDTVRRLNDGHAD
ncbi:ATP-binding protein [Geobacter sp. SVR]|uniref:ATP-binding protein n=1 Tax=Geobacter sp. SVR TaxID=2495594 RepID=UPI00143EF98C|nr:ATP-binding protein [Geobacter sp. SVR]BCS55625.1 hypothetical protein GSVR_39330 [Geobacter sp. SVR]GCF83628.1 hypothetical protein GSbR_02280 [Geobacter sp. SVR]